MPNGGQQAAEPQFAAVAEVGKGRFPLRTTRGVVRVDAGVLTIRKQNGDPIGSEMPVNEIRARGQRGSAGGAVRIWAGDSTYLLKWNPSATAKAASGQLAATAVVGTELGRAANVALSLPKQRKITEQFMAAIGADDGPAE